MYNGDRTEFALDMVLKNKGESSMMIIREAVKYKTFCRLHTEGIRKLCKKCDLSARLPMFSALLGHGVFVTMGCMKVKELSYTLHSIVSCLTLTIGARASLELSR